MSRAVVGREAGAAAAHQVLPQTPLLAKSTYVVKVPAHQLRYMTTDVSFKFTTRAEDVTKPRAMAYGRRAALT